MNYATPIEMMLDGVTWAEAPQQDADPDGLPHVTHSGVLEILGAKLRVYRLNNGQSVIDADDAHALFEEMQS